MSEPFRVPSDAPFEVKAAAAARHDLPPGAKMIVTPETLESCARAAERAGNHEQAVWLRALAENQRRLERLAAEREYVMHYRRDHRGRVRRTRPYVPARRVRRERPPRAAGAGRSRGRRVANASTGPPPEPAPTALPPPDWASAPTLEITRRPATAVEAERWIDGLARLLIAAYEQEES